MITSEQTLTGEEIQKLNERALLELLNQALRKPESNEKRMLGILLEVDCDPNAVIYAVKTGDKILKFTSSSVENVALISFESETVNSQFGCNLFKADKFAVITDRPASETKTDFSGELKAIEFVPKNFIFIDLSRIKNRTHFKIVQI